MNWIFAILLFSGIFSNVASAQHEQTVKPVKIGDVLEATQFHLKEYLEQIRKKAVGISLLGSSKLRFERTHFTCGGTQPQGAAADLYIVRIQQQQKLAERLVLESCGTQMEILSLERQGPSVVPTADANLLRGIVPSAIPGESYKLTVLDRRHLFEITKTYDQTKMFWGVVERNTGYADVQMHFDEKYTDKILNRQFASLLIFTGTQVREEHTMEFIWNIEPKFKTARQYLFYRGSEIPPFVYIDILFHIYSEWLFPFLKSEFTYSAF
jgi:hypothetical protein